jgi:hypothetical protein
MRKKPSYYTTHLLLVSAALRTTEVAKHTAHERNAYTTPSPTLAVLTKQFTERDAKDASRACCALGGVMCQVLGGLVMWWWSSACSEKLHQDSEGLVFGHGILSTPI